MEDRVVEVLKEFHEDLGNILTYNEKQRIKNRDRFEDDIIKPKLWNFLKERIRKCEISDFCIIREYNLLNFNLDLDKNSEEVLDLAFLNRKYCQVEYGMEIKGLPLKGNKGFYYHRDNQSEIGKDFIKLSKLVHNRLIKKGIFLISLAYENNKNNPKIEDIEEFSLLKISILSRIIKEILALCYDKNENSVGASAPAIREYINKNQEKSLDKLINELKEYCILKNLIPKDRCFYYIFQNCKCNILKKTDKYKKLFQAVTIKPINLTPDIDLGDNIKIRNFLFVIEPNQSSWGKYL